MDPSTPELLRLSSQLLSPLEYFTDSSNTINTKTDVVLVVGKEKFYCHRLLLSLVSPVFARMFDGQFKEHNEREIVLEGKSSEAILELLKFIYPQFNGQITNDNIEHFLQLSDEYMIDHLKQPCKEFLMNQLRQFKYVSLPTKEKIVQASTKPKNFHTSDSALDSSRTHEGHSSEHENPNRLHPPQRPTSNSRHTTTTTTTTTNKPASSFSRHGDRTGSSSNTPQRHFISLDKTRLPTFYNEQKTIVLFTNDELEMWLRRLCLLYQVDKGRNYGEVIDSILSILQFVPTNILFPLVHPTRDTCSAMESILNDIARARMYTLEDWSSDSNSYRAVVLPESYQTMSLSNLMAAQQTIIVSSKPTENEESSFQSVVTVTSDQDEPISSLDSDTD